MPTSTAQAFLIFLCPLINFSLTYRMLLEATKLHRAMSDVQSLNELVSELLQLPRHILQHMHTAGLTDILLGHLASKSYFNLKKAAYLLNNPDFNCVKGMAGIEISDTNHWQNPWSNPLEHTKFLENSSFNKKVKTFVGHGLFTNPSQEDTPRIIKYAEEHLALENPVFIGWHGKHGNHGIFFCEPQRDSERVEQSVTGRSCVTTSKESPSQQFGDWQGVEE